MRKSKIISLLLVGAFCLSFAGCSVKSPNKLLRYAKRTYGECELVDSEQTDDYTRIVVRDELQGFEYQITSGMCDMNLDGSSFGSLEDTRSSFGLALKEYVFGEVQDEQAGIDAALECARILQEYNLENRMDNWKIVVQAYQAYNDDGDKRYGSVVLPDIEWVSHEQENANYFLDIARDIADTGADIERVAETTYQAYPTSADSPVTFYYYKTGDGTEFYVCDFLYYVNDYYDSDWYNNYEGAR